MRNVKQNIPTLGRAEQRRQIRALSTHKTPGPEVTFSNNVPIHERGEGKPKIGVTSSEKTGPMPRITPSPY